VDLLPGLARPFRVALFDELVDATVFDERSGRQPHLQPTMQRSGAQAARPAGPRAGLMAKILVTGGSGYFGSVLVDQALARGDEVRVFDLNPPGKHAGEVDFVPGDVRDRDAVRRACAGVEA